MINGNIPSDNSSPSINAKVTPGKARCAKGSATTDIFLESIRVPVYAAVALIKIALIIVKNNWLGILLMIVDSDIFSVNFF